jgi:hypothetical protein
MIYYKNSPKSQGDNPQIPKPNAPQVLLGAERPETTELSDGIHRVSQLEV